MFDLDTGLGHVASPNMQYIMGSADWSPDGTKLAYAMSVRGPTDLDLFMTDLSARSVTRVTSTNGTLNPGDGIGMRSRFDALADAILYSRSEGSTSGGDWITGTSRARLSDGAVTALEHGVTGATADVARDQKHVLVVRQLSVDSNGIVDAQLVLRTVSTGSERVLLPHGQIQSATFASDGVSALAMINGYSASNPVDSYSFKRVSLSTGSVTNIRVPAAATRAEVYIAK